MLKNLLLCCEDNSFSSSYVPSKNLNQKLEDGSILRIFIFEAVIASLYEHGSTCLAGALKPVSAIASIIAAMNELNVEEEIFILKALPDIGSTVKSTCS